MGIEKIATIAAKNYFSKSVNLGAKNLVKKALEPIEYHVCKKSGIEQFFRNIQKLEGTEASLKISKSQLAILPEPLQKLLEPLLAGTKNPVARIAYKAKSNYNVAGIKVTDGNRVIGTAAASITKPGSADAVIKARLNIPNKVEANGFIDGSRPMDSYNVSSALDRCGGKIKAKFQTDEIGFRVNGNENEIQKLLMGLKPESEYGFRARYSKITHKLQRSFDDVGAKIRYFLRGNKGI